MFLLLIGNRVTLNSVQDGGRDVASTIISHEQTQSNRVCCFQTLDAVFPKDCVWHARDDIIIRITHSNRLVILHNVNYGGIGII